MYLSNLSHRNPTNETILGFYLTLTLNNRWDAFRSAEPVSPEEYLSDSKSSIIKTLLQEQQQTIKAVTADIGIDPKDIPKFIRLIQSETQSVILGSVETIDTKLINVTQNINELLDPDLYQETLDKQRLEILKTFGNFY